MASFKSEWTDSCNVMRADYAARRRLSIYFDEQVVDWLKQMQWKPELAGKWIAPVTGNANAAIRRAIQHLKIGRAAGKTDLARACSPKRIATQNEKLVPLHTKRIG